ncbi:GNAT family N-acetyltransferase [Jiella pelagia]|uniref:N-acetyltransferase domain-containing protein n=1 Tax=Jiella pelagia TaxID=2986949 RepID=A0ABY7BXD0_9HYPH|nr:GNAT family N-acetyltransferase [Jiella pelagia]WAP67626.1 hypothetical protein OH818_19330 [Jiella pelagia]
MIEAAAAPETRYAPLDGAHLDAVMQLHLAATGAVGRADLIKPENRDFFERILTGAGRMFGVWRGGAFVGYGVLQLDLPPSEDARPQLGLKATESLAKLAGACVLPEAWGHGIHDALIEIRVAEARRLGLDHLYATAAPGNARSWENLLAAGFSVCGLVEKYGGHQRYLLHRREGAPQRPTDDGVWLGAEDTAGQVELIAKGWAAGQWRRRADGGRDLFYRGPA